MQLTVGTFNIEHLGWALGKGHHRLDKALDFLLTHTPEPPDILALPEATHCLDNGQYVLRSRVVYPLSQRLSDGWYEPLYASQGLPYQRNHHNLLLVNTAKVKPTRWHDPSGVMAASKRLSGFAEVEVFGHTLLVCCEHWRGGEGRDEFFRAAHRVSTHGGNANKTLLLGDFNTTSGWSEEHLPADWYERCRQRGELGKLAQKDGKPRTAGGRSTPDKWICC